MGVIQRQSIKNFFTSYIGILIGFVNVLIVQPRFLTPEELGLTRVLFSFSLLLSTVVPMGAANIIVKYFPHFRNPEKRHHGFFGFIVLATLIGFILTAAILFLCRNYIIGQYIERSKLFADFFYYVFPLTFFLTFIAQLNLYCYSLYKTTVPVFLNDIVTRIGIIILVSLYYLKLFPLQLFILLFVVTYGLQVALQVFYIYYEEKPGFKIDLPKFKNVGWRNMYGYATVVWMATISSIGLRELAPVILGAKISLEQTGIYAVAAFIPVLIEAPLNAMDKIATFKISNALALQHLHEVSDIYKKSARYMFLLGCWLFLCINSNSESMLQFLPVQYRGSATIILIISCGTLINMATGLNSQVLFYSHKFYYGAATMIGAVILNFYLQVKLIPAYGLNGAAIATAVSSVFLNLTNSIIIYKHHRLDPFDNSTLKILLLFISVWLIDSILPHHTNYWFDIILHGGFITLLYGTVSYKLNFIPELNVFVKSGIDFVSKRR